MSSLAVVLVLTSAVTHATWNLLTKRVEGGAVFVWLFSLASMVVYAPLVVVVIVLGGTGFSTTGLLLVMVSATLHMGYFVVLSRGYRVGDLSLVYPLARGTGPLLATAAAIVILGERPHPIAIAGALLVVAGAVSLGINPYDLLYRSVAPAVALAVTTGAFIAAYTLVDKQAVSTVGVAPLVYTWATDVGVALWLSPAALRKPAEVERLWRMHKRAALGIGILSPLAYILVLSALVFSPVSYVAPAREIGVLFGALMGFQFLGEGQVRRRLSAATLMVVGVVLLVL